MDGWKRVGGGGREASLLPPSPDRLDSLARLFQVAEVLVGHVPLACSVKLITSAASVASHGTAWASYDAEREKQKKENREKLAATGEIDVNYAAKPSLVFSFLFSYRARVGSSAPPCVMSVLGLAM